MSSAVAELRNALARLNTHRSEIDSRIAALNGALRSLGGSLGPGISAARAASAGRDGRGRARRGSLKHYILRVLQGGGVMAVKDVTVGVRKSGFRTRNKTLAKSVGTTMASMPEVAKVGRGRFRLK
jgi:hypothetical protein